MNNNHFRLEQGNVVQKYKDGSNELGHHAWLGGCAILINRYNTEI